MDSNLERVVQGEARRGDLPLALRRFAEVAQTTRPTEAIICAVDQLLARYAWEFGPKLPISVQALCKLVGAAIAGPLPSQRSSGPYTASPSHSESGHTGLLRFGRSKPIIAIPDYVDYEVARLSVAHEIGHLLLHLRGSELDQATLRLPADSSEEALAEFAARLLLLPTAMWLDCKENTNLSEYAVSQSSRARVSVHSAVARLGDPDLPWIGAEGAILWRELPEANRSWPLHERMTPWWHLCPSSFVPIRRSKARPGSLVALIAGQSGSNAASSVEDVNIGTFAGRYRIDAFAWGSLEKGSRVVLTVFREPRSFELPMQLTRQNELKQQSVLALDRAQIQRGGP